MIKLVDLIVNKKAFFVVIQIFIQIFSFQIFTHIFLLQKKKKIEKRLEINAL